MQSFGDWFISFSIRALYVKPSILISDVLGVAPIYVT